MFQIWSYFSYIVPFHQNKNNRNLFPGGYTVGNVPQEDVDGAGGRNVASNQSRLVRNAENISNRIIQLPGLRESTPVTNRRACCS